MGAGSWSSTDWSKYATKTATKSTAEVFSTVSIKKDLNPLGVKVRESRDSTVNPVSTAIIVGLDVTGSMGMIADTMARKGLGILFQEILDRKPVTDPHLMFMAIGDAYFDKAPLQVSQFEADNKIIEQLTDIWLEKGGGGNEFESYNLPWYFAANHTSIDCFEKRGKKGYLFTVGDENVPGPLTIGQIKQFIGDDIQADMSSADLLEQASKMYHVFHVIVEEGNYARHRLSQTVNAWTNLMGQHVIRLSDHTKLSEVIVSTIQLTEGVDKASIVSSWTGDTSMVVSKAIDSLVANGHHLTKGGKPGVVRL